ncbi:MAG: 50S ribosomal protein L25 [Deltaproteobacteria bacterium]|nr:50S ribosomal protein L25 [Deltaproteobacteria bacterium]
MSTQTVLAATARPRTGKGSARAARREGRIPAVVYSHFSDPAAISVDPAELRKMVMGSDHRFNTVLTLDVEGSEKKTALLKDWQVDPVSRKLLHADFVEIRLDQKLEADVPVKLVGTPKGVTNGGILSQIRREATVRCLPSDIPAILEVDVSKLDINDSLHIADVTPPEKVELVFQINFTLAVITPPEKEAVVATDELAGAAPVGSVAAAAAAPAEDGGEAEGEGGDA